jgi:hypothetical protein
MTKLTREQVIRFYNKNPGFGIVQDFHIDEVCPSDMYHVTDEILPYLHCVEHFLRIQMVHLGNRWFDMKRYGFEATHKMGISDVYHLDVLDSRYAIQIPNEVIGAGLQPNERTTVKAENSLVMKKDAFVRAE